MAETILASEMSFSIWCRIMQEVTSDDSLDHSVIGYSLTANKKEISKYTIQTKAEYEVAKDSHQLMTLRAIIDHSLFVLVNIEDKIENTKFFTSITNQVQFSPAKETKLTSAIREHAKPFKILPDVLEKMCARATRRRLEEKTQGIWETILQQIKWYIWVIFYDKSNEVREIKQLYAENNPIIKKIQEVILKKLQSSPNEGLQNILDAITDPDFLQGLE